MWKLHLVTPSFVLYLFFRYPEDGTVFHLTSEYCKCSIAHFTWRLTIFGNANISRPFKTWERGKFSQALWCFWGLAVARKYNFFIMFICLTAKLIMQIIGLKSVVGYWAKNFFNNGWMNVFWDCVERGKGIGQFSWSKDGRMFQLERGCNRAPQECFPRDLLWLLMGLTVPPFLILFGGMAVPCNSPSTTPL